MTKKNKAKGNESRFDTLVKSEKRYADAFTELSTRLDKATNVENRSWTPEEAAELDEATKRLSQVRSEMKSESARVVEAREALEARELALGSTGNVGGAHITNGLDNLVYSPGNPDNSFYRDLLMANGGFVGTRRAQKRLDQHQLEMENIQRRSTRSSKEYRAVTHYFQEARRSGGVEVRETILNGGPGITSAGSPNDMAPFAPPIFFLPEYADWRTYGRTFLGILKSFPLPATGMSFFVPKITTPTVASFQASEGASITTQDLASEYESGTLQTVVNNLNVSQQYLDRVGPGLQGDQIVNRDQTAQLNRALNIYAYQTVLQNAAVGTQSFTDTSTTYPTFNGGAVSDYRAALARGSIAIQTTDGTVAYPTHFVTDVNVWESIAAAVDDSHRPYIVPQGVAFNPLATGVDSASPEGYTGYTFAGVPAFKDQALQVSAAATLYAGAGVTGVGSAAFDADSGNHLGIMGAFDLAVYWLEGTPVLRVVPQPGASN